MAEAVSTAARSAEVHRLGYLHLAVSGALTALAIFVSCWVAAHVPPFNATHAYISLFTEADILSGRALVDGGFWSLVFGAFAATMFAAVYNLTAPLAR